MHTVEVMQLCRLCLVKEQVDVPIFDGDGEMKQIFQKISSCLPVKVARGDNYPQKICTNCSTKLDEVYDFWTESKNSEKLLAKWIGPPTIDPQPILKKQNLGKETAVKTIEEPTKIFMKEENTESFRDNNNENFEENNDAFMDPSEPSNDYSMWIKVEAEDENENEEMETENSDFISAFFDSGASSEEAGPSGASTSGNQSMTLNNQPPTNPDFAIPEKSRKVYERYYKQFMDWRRKNKITSFDEGVILRFFQDFSKIKQPPSIWTSYFILKTLLNARHQIDIATFTSVYAFVKENSRGYEGKQLKLFTPDHIKRFIELAPNKKYLLQKVVLIFGVIGCCRKVELHNLKYENVVDLESALLVTIKNVATKKIRKFTITGRYYAICKRYMKLRPVNCTSPAFFLNYTKGFCTDQNVGINKLGRMGREIATFLNIPDPHLYTGHCFRKSSTNILVDDDGDIITPEKISRFRRPNLATTTTES